MSNWGQVHDTGVCENNNPFVQALALQSYSRNYSPVPDLVLWKLTFRCEVFSRGVFFHRHRYVLKGVGWLWMSVGLLQSRPIKSNSKAWFPWSLWNHTTCCPGVLLKERTQPKACSGIKRLLMDQRSLCATSPKFMPQTGQSAFATNVHFKIKHCCLNILECCIEIMETQSVERPRACVLLCSGTWIACSYNGIRFMDIAWYHARRCADMWYTLVEITLRRVSIALSGITWISELYK